MAEIEARLGLALPHREQLGRDAVRMVDTDEARRRREACLVPARPFQQAHQREGRGADAQATEERAPADRRHGEPRRVKPGPFT